MYFRSAPGITAYYLYCSISLLMQPWLPDPGHFQTRCLLYESSRVRQIQTSGAADSLLMKKGAELQFWNITSDVLIKNIINCVRNWFITGTCLLLCRKKLLKIRSNVTWYCPHWWADIYTVFPSCIIPQHLPDRRQCNNIRRGGKQSTTLPVSLYLSTNIHTYIDMVHTHTTPWLPTTLLCWETGGLLYQESSGSVRLLETTGRLPAPSFNNVKWTDGCQNETTTCGRKMNVYSI